MHVIQHISYLFCDIQKDTTYSSQNISFKCLKKLLARTFHAKQATFQLLFLENSGSFCV